MADDNRPWGSTSNIVRMKLRNSSTGNGLTGLTYQSSSLRISTLCDNESASTSYTSSNIEDIAACGTFATPTTSKARFAAVDGTNHPGLYELQIANARFAVTGAKKLWITVSGATDLRDETYTVEFGTWVSPYLVDSDSTWRFDNASQTTAPNTITKLIGFNGLLAMDFTELLPVGGSIASVTSVSVADVGGETEPTITTSAVSADKKKVIITTNATSATDSTYTLTVTVLTTDAQTLVGKGRLVIV